MSQATGVINTKLYNQFGNALDFSVTTDFASGLVANVGDLVKIVYLIDVGFEASGDVVDTWDITGALDNNTVIRSVGSFILDGFEVGDSVDYFIDLSTGTPTVTARTVTAVTDLLLIFDGVAVANQSGLTTGGLQVSTEFLDFSFKFALPTTGEGSNYLSKIDSFETKYLTNIDTGGGVPSGSLVAGTYEASFPTSQDTDGEFEMFFVGNQGNNVKRYQVEHTFRIKPWYLDGSLSDIQNGVLPSYFSGGNTLNNAFEFRPLTTTGNPNNRKALTNLTTGNVGWFDELFNGNTARFTLNSISYTDKISALAVDGLQVDRVTQVQIKIDSPGLDLDNNASYGVFINKLPVRSEYQLNSNDFDTNFVFDYGINPRNAAAADFDFIKQVVVTAGSPAADQIIIDFEVDYSAAQQLLLDTNTYYSIGVGCGHITKSSTVRQAVLADVHLYVEDNDVPGLLKEESFEFLTHPDSLGGGYSDVKRPNEHKFLSVLNFSIDTSKSAFIKKITERLVAFNTVDDEFFDIEVNEFDTSNVIISGGIQQIEIDQSKGFKLADDSIFNTKKITTGALVGVDQNYTIEMAHAFNWMDYLALAGVDTDFYNATLLNNGLNQKIERYSGNNNYNIGVFWDFEMSDGLTDTTYRIRSTELDVLDYDESDAGDPFSSQQIQVFLSDMVTEITGNMDPVETMYIKATFTPTVPISTSLNYYGVFRLERYRAGGLNAIWERSSINDSIDFNPILPLSGDTYPKVTNNGTTITLEGRVDPTRFVDIGIGDTVHLTAEIGQTAPGGKLTEAGVQKTTESGLFKVVE